MDSKNNDNVVVPVPNVISEAVLGDERPDPGTEKFQLAPQDGIFIFGFVVTAISMWKGHWMFGLIFFILATYVSGVTEVPLYHRGLWVVLGTRWSVACKEGKLRWKPPCTRLLLFNTQESAEVMAYEDFVTSDGLPIAFRVTTNWHAAREEDEGPKRWYHWLFSRAQKLFKFSWLKKGTAEVEIREFTKELVETFIAPYTHEELLGINYLDLTNAIKIGADDPVMVKNEVKAIMKREPSPEIKARRIEIAEKIKTELNRILSLKGIVLNDFILSDFDFPRAFRTSVFRILDMKIEKVAEMIDVVQDIQRVIKFIEAAKARNVTVPFPDAYTMIRKYDNEETAAKSGVGGQFSQLLQALIRLLGNQGIATPKSEVPVTG